jgi:hypothetical protein
MRKTDVIVFRDRTDAARRVAALLAGRDLRDPLVLAVPRGGVAVGAVLARELGAELDVVLARKIPAPFRTEYALGAVAEDGAVLPNPSAPDPEDLPDGYLEAETRRQFAEIERRRELVRGVRPAAPVAGRSVVVTDDGIATGSTMIAALQTVRAKRPHELIAAVPVAAPDRLDEVRRWCDDAVCVRVPADFRAVGQYYDDFVPVEYEDVLRLLGEAVRPGGGPG